MTHLSLSKEPLWVDRSVDRALGRVSRQRVVTWSQLSLPGAPNQENRSSGRTPDEHIYVKSSVLAVSALEYEILVNL